MGDPREKCDPKCARRLVDINSPRIHGAGPQTAKIVFVGEAPGQEEDRLGEPFVGASGQLLNDLFKEIGLKRDEVYITNAVKCATRGENMKPTKTEITKCRAHLVKEIAKIQPTVIVAVGASALEAVMRRAGIVKLQNNILFSDEFKTKVVPVVHPAYVLRNPAAYVDLKKGVELAVVESASHDKVTQASLVTQHVSVKTPEQINRLLTLLEQTKEFCIDLETDALDARIANIILISFSWKRGMAVTVQWSDLSRNQKIRLGKLLTSDRLKIGHNLKFDIRILHMHGLSVTGPIFDCLPAIALLNENLKEKGLDALVLRYLDMGEYWADLEKFKKEYARETKTKVREFTYDKVPIKILAKYARFDADATFRLYLKFKKWLEKEGLSTFYAKYTLPTFWVILEMETMGIRVDRKKLKKLWREYKVKIAKAQVLIYSCKDVKRYENIQRKKTIKALLDKYTGSKNLKNRYPEFDAYRKARWAKLKPQFNPKSTKQLREILYDMLDLEIINETDKGLPSTDEKTLALIKNVELVNLILDHRRLTKFASTYIKAIYKKSKLNGRVHPSYMQHRTVTGRLASESPNFQNIPREAYDLKSCFLADPGMVIVKADLAQAEFRCWAHCSNDRRMISDIESGLDIHRRTASEVFRIPEEQVTKDQRTAAKSCVFGLMYGRGTKAVAEQFGISEEQAKMVRKIFFSKYPDASLWLDKQVALAEETGRVKTWMGRIRRIPEIHSEDGMVKAEAERQAKNCVDFKTEVLTKRGWISGWKLSMQDFILAKNSKSNKLEWQRPIAINRYGDYHGPIFHVESKSFSAATTPEHRWLVFDKKTETDKCVNSSSISKYGDQRIHRTGKYLEHSSVLTEADLASLIGWVVTDGHFLTGKHTGDAISIGQSYRANPTKVKKIESLLNRLDIRYSRSNHKKTCCAHFKFSGPLASFIRSVVPNKKLSPGFLLSLSSKHLQLLFEAMLDGDGHVDKDKTSFYTADESEADAFQFLCVLLGKATSKRFEDLTEYVKVNAAKCKKMGNIPSRSVRWTVTVLRRDKVQVLPGQHKTLIEHRGVWCPTVPNSFFVARRKGFVYVTGNSPIQGLASDMNNHFMVKNIKLARKNGIVCYPMSTVHDANIVQVRKDQVKKMVKIMKHVIATAFPDFRCVMKLDFEIGKTLGTLEALKDG